MWAYPYLWLSTAPDSTSRGNGALQGSGTTTAFASCQPAVTIIVACPISPMHNLNLDEIRAFLILPPFTGDDPTVHRLPPLLLELPSQNYRLMTPNLIRMAIAASPRLGFPTSTPPHLGPLMPSQYGWPAGTRTHVHGGGELAI